MKSIGRLGYEKQANKWALGGLLYKKSLDVRSGNVRLDGIWKYLGFGFWWKVLKINKK